MSWPSGSKASNQYTDNASDLIADARADINQTILNVNTMIDYFGTNGAYSEVGQWNRQQYFNLQTLTDGASISWDLNTSQVATVTLGGNRTINFSNAQAGATYILFVKQDGTGSRTLTFGSAADNFKFPGGGSPALSTAANSVDIVTFISDGTTMYGTIAKGYV